MEREGCWLVWGGSGRLGGVGWLVGGFGDGSGEDLPIPICFAFSCAASEAILAASRLRLGTERVVIVAGWLFFGLRASRWWV